MLTYPLHTVGSTGNSRASIQNTNTFKRVEVEFNIEAVGATPTVSFQVKGLVPGGDSATATDWVILAVLTSDSTIAASNALVVLTAVGKTRRYIDGLDKRFFDALAVESSANTNVTYSTSLNCS